VTWVTCFSRNWSCAVPSGSRSFPTVWTLEITTARRRAADKSRKVRGPPSGEPVAAVVARGEANISQVGELIQVPGMTFVVTIPTEVQPMIFFAAALASTAKQPREAPASTHFLASPEAGPGIKKGGLTPLSRR
jgi:molybdate transport system substrate-binding protein